MNEKLTSALRTLAAENTATLPPPDLEAKILALASRGRVRTPRARWMLPVVATALVAALAVLLLLRNRPVRPEPTAEVAFTAIPYVAPPAPYERTEVKRMDVPYSALIAAGFDIRVPDAGATVRADVLIGQDGRPLAVRLVRNATL